VYVHQGLVDLMGYDESMLAGVMAHEIGHAKDRHVAKGYEKQMQGGTAIGLLGALLGNKSKQSQLVTTLLANAGSLMYLKYNRDQEEWADRYGVTLAYGAGYDAYGMARGLECLEALYGSSGKAQNIFENHPPNASRIRRTLEIAQETTGKPHGYSKVPQPPSKDHPLWKLYGPQGTGRANLGKPLTVISDEAATVTKQTKPAQKESEGAVDVPVTKHGS
jgi:predicted Zn-dependent protease